MNESSLIRSTFARLWATTDVKIQIEDDLVTGPVIII